MEFLIGAISLVSLVFNYLIYRRITAAYQLGTIEELEPLATYHCCCEVVVEHLESFKQEESHGSPPEVKHTEAYQAWTNRQGIPAIEVNQKSDPPIKHNSEGRPYGWI